MKKRFYIIPGLIVLALVSLTGWRFFDFVEGDLVTEQRLTGPGADAIVVLTGGKGRIDEGVRLLKEGAAGALVLSGVDEDADMDAIFINGIDSGVREKITLEKISGSTFENAVEVKRIAAHEGYRSIIFITSAYHMKRALLIFRHILPGDINISPRPVSSPNFDEQRRWAGKNLAITIPEFLKYQWYDARFRAEELFG